MGRFLLSLDAPSAGPISSVLRAKHREISMSKDNADINEMLPGDLLKLKQDVMNRISSLEAETADIEQKVIRRDSVNELHQFLRDIESRLNSYEKGRL
jgi:hypothetical protein